MSENPKAALDAILDEDVEVAGLKIRKLTAARYALLELVDSPFTDFSKQFTVSSLVPSLYICTAETSQLKGWNSKNIEGLVEKSMEWADTVDLSEIGPAVDHILEQLREILKIAPGTGSAEDGQKKTDAAMTTDS